MNKKHLRRIVGFILTAILLLGTFVVETTTAAAQRRGRRVVIVRPFPRDPFRFNRLDYYRYRQYVFDNGDEAYREGYDAGLNTGRSDGKKNKSYDPERSHYFKDSGFGNFADAYRSGFTNGYRDGYGNRIG